MAKIIKRKEGDEPTPAPRGPSPDLMGPGKVIDREVVDASEKARLIVEEARRQAHELVETAKGEAERVRERARDEGREEARAEANALLVKARIEREKVLASAEPQLVKLARRIAEKIIGRELEAQPDVIADVVRQAIQTVRQQREIIVRVNPADLDALESRRQDLIAALARAKDVTLRGDPDISQGGCVVESELGTIDAQLETQLDVIERILAGEGGS